MWAVFRQSKYAFVSEVMNSSDGQHLEPRAVGGQLTNGGIGELTVPDAEMQQVWAVVGKGEDDVVRDALESGKKQRFQTTAVFGNLLNYYRGQLQTGQEGKEGERANWLVSARTELS